MERFFSQFVESGNAVWEKLATKTGANMFHRLFEKIEILLQEKYVKIKTGIKRLFARDNLQFN